MSLSMPHDHASADDVMKYFNDKAYSRNLKPIFQEAIDVLYRPNIFEVQEDNSGRMLFSCKLCNNDMNSHEALKQHHLSGKHQKNYDKKAQEDGITIEYFKAGYRSARHYPPGSLQDRLLNSTGTPIGLQMLEEYQNRGKSYFRCILCGAHGRLDAVYKHAIGPKHTEKYIKVSLELESSILSSNERETLARHISEKYGRNAVDYIKVIKGNEYYPHKWEAEGKAHSLKNDKIKKQPQSPKRSEKRSPSVFSRNGSPSLDHKSRRHRSPSPTNSHYSRGRSSQSPQPSTSRSRFSESPPRRRHRERHDSENNHRNRSPPSSRGGPRTPPPMPKGRARTPPPPPPLSLSMVDTKNVGIQKVDLDELMVQLNFLVKSQNMPESDLKTDTDLDLAIRMMWNISLGLFYINKNQMESEDQPSHVRDTLSEQQGLFRKILGYLRNYMGPEVGLELHENGIKELRNCQQNYQH